MDPMAWLTAHWTTIASYLAFVSVGASALVAATPTPPAGSVLSGPYRFLEIIAGAFGYAKDHGIITPTAGEVQAANQAVQLGREVIATIHVKPGNVPVPQLAGDATATAVAVIQALRDQGLIAAAPTAPAPPVTG